MKQLALLILISSLFTSCMTLDKAIHKVVSADHFTPTQEALLLVKYKSMYSDYEWTTEGTQRIDSAERAAVMKVLEQQIEEAKRKAGYYENIISDQGQDNETLREMLFQSKRERDSLIAARQGAIKVPCPVIQITDTTFKRATEEVRLLQIQLTKSDQENARLQVENATLRAEKESALAEVAAIKKQLTQTKWDRIKRDLLAGLIGAIGVTAVGIFLKFRKII